jgi:hypothetical protein
MPPNP